MRLRMLRLLMLLAVCLMTVLDATAAEPVRYRFGLLRRGPGYTPERNAHTDSIQAGHMANIQRMASAGALLSAGPFADGGDLRGVFVFRPGHDALDSLMAGDPAIASRRLVCDTFDWLAPAGLSDEYRARAATGAPDSMTTFPLVLLRPGPRPDADASSGIRKFIERHRRDGERKPFGGRLVFAGRTEGTDELRGILIFKGDKKSVERAVQSDPAVRAGRFVPQVITWWTAVGTIPGH